MSKYIETPCGTFEVPPWERERVEKLTDQQIKDYLLSNPKFIDPFIVAEAQQRKIKNRGRINNA